MSQRNKASLFDSQKKQVLSDLTAHRDASPKGSVDERCLPIMDILNRHADYVTTSSCSGRVCLWAGTEKGQGGWPLVSHEVVDPDAVVAAVTSLEPSFSNVVLKMEPFVLHVQCRDIAASHRILVPALDCGYRNSGVIPGKKHTMLAMRHTCSMEVPIGCDGVVLVDETYLRKVVEIANAKLRDNHRSLDKLVTRIQSTLATSTGDDGSTAEAE
eukprot:PhM_4_TR15693/c0_g1_i1/m.54420/K15450/TYW3; tRNA wybutosine-synthesizing protein 3